MIKKIDKFEKNNPDIAVNVLFDNKKNHKKTTCAVHRSGRNGKCKKQLNLLMIVDGEKRRYTAIKNISRLLSKLNGYHYCMNCQEKISTISTAAAMVTSRSICQMKKKMVKISRYTVSV